MNEHNGKLNWIFADGELPPKGDNPDFPGHESLMITNVNDKDAHITIDILFDDRDPVKGLTCTVGAERVKCLRLDKKICDQEYQIPYGQYALVIHSDVPVAAVFGRLDVRQANMSFYSVQGYSYN